MLSAVILRSISAALLLSIFLTTLASRQAQAGFEFLKPKCAVAYDPIALVSSAQPGLEYANYIRGHRISGVAPTQIPSPNHQIPTLIPPGAAVEFLGKGAAGGYVYLIKTRTRSYVMKKYFAARLADRDAIKFEALRRAKQDLALNGRSTFIIPQVRKTGEGDVLEIEYFGGRTLKDVLSDETLTKDLRDRLRQELTQRIQIVRSHMETNPGESKIEGYFSVEIGSQKHQLFLKPDNIILTPDGEFILIDPF